MFYFSGDWQSASEYFTEALKVDAECTEALYNLGLASKKMNKFDSALEAFHKLQHIQRKNPQVMFQIADIYRLIEDSGASVDWLNQVLVVLLQNNFQEFFYIWFCKAHSIMQTDPALLQELGQLHDQEGDKSAAFQFRVSVDFSYYRFKKWKYFHFDTLMTVPLRRVQSIPWRYSRNWVALVLLHRKSIPRKGIKLLQPRLSNWATPSKVAFDACLVLTQNWFVLFLTLTFSYGYFRQLSPGFG